MNAARSRVSPPARTSSHLSMGPSLLKFAASFVTLPEGSPRAEADEYDTFQADLDFDETALRQLDLRQVARRARSLRRGVATPRAPRLEA